MAKVDVAERTFWLSLADGDNYLDIGFLMSQINRKLYRQGMEYVVADIELLGDAQSVSGTYVTVERLPMTWTLCNAWSKAFYHWKEQQNDAMRDADAWDSLGAYNDFKVYMDDAHWNFANGKTLDERWLKSIAPLTVTQSSAELALIAAGAPPGQAKQEWDMSQFVIPNAEGVVGDTVECEMIMVGNDDTAAPERFRSAVLAYAESRARPPAQDPNVVSSAQGEGGLYSEMFDDGMTSDTVMDNIRYKNNTPPYLVTDSLFGSPSAQFEFYPGGGFESALGEHGGVMVEDFLVVRPGSTVSTATTGPFSVPCGLLKFETNLDEQDNALLKVTLAPGMYQGVMARPMQDVN